MSHPGQSSSTVPILINMSSSVFDSDVNPIATWSMVGQLPGDSDLKRINIPAAGVTVGRRKGVADIVLPSSYISNEHARLVPRGMGLEIIDLGSRNGTFLRRERISGVQLANSGDTVAFADIEFQLEAMASDGKTDEFNTYSTMIGADSFEGDWTLSNFARLIQGRLVTPVMQPIIELGTRQMIGLEALARSNVCGLETPARMFEVAELLNQAAVLSDICREKAIDAARGIPGDQRLFLNTHPHECLARDVLRSVDEIRKSLPTLRLVIEVHEDLIEELAETRSFARKLAQMGAELALDDFGAGRSRINEVLRLRPAFVKFDRSLISNIDHAPQSDREAIKSLVELLNSLSIHCVAEGIERREEAAVCHDLGFGYAQGFFFAPPARIEQLCLTDRFQSWDTLPERRGGIATKEYAVVGDA